MHEPDEMVYRRYRANRGEDDLRLLFERYRENLTLFLLNYVRHEEDAEDLMMEAFAVVAACTSSFSGKSSFKTWLFAIGRNQACNFLRKRSRDSADRLAPAGQTEDAPEFELLRKEENRELYRAMETLPDDYRQALYLLYFEQMSHDEACIVMRKTKGQMYNLVKRGRQALRDALERMGYGERWDMQ